VLALSSDIDTTSKDKTELSLDLKIFCQKDFDLWRKNILTTSPPTQYKIIQMIGDPIILTKEEFCDKITGELTPCRQNKIKPDFILKTENNSVSIDKPKMSTDVLSMSLDRSDFAGKVVSCTVVPTEQRLFNQKCPVCGEKRDHPWQLKFFDNTTTTCCNTCGSTILEKQRTTETEENTHET